MRDKNTLHDLDWLWQRGLVQHIRQCVHRGCAIMGICGGYQMLGVRIIDTEGVENVEGRAALDLTYLKELCDLTDV